MAAAECPKNISPRRWEHLKKIAPLGYAGYVRKVILLYPTPDSDEPYNYDRIAQHVSGSRRLQFGGFKHRRGLTGTNIRIWAEKLGLVAQTNPTPIQTNAQETADDIPF